MLLNNKHKDKIIQILDSVLDIKCEVMAYGSRVRGDAHDASDLDIIIKSMDGFPIQKSKMKTLALKFQESNIPIIIDLRDWALVPKYFHKYILESFEIFYKKE